MYKMVDKEYIRKLYYMEDWPIRKISRQLQISRQAIRKMIEDTEKPKYEIKKERPSPVMDQYLEILRQWIEEDEKAPRKQRHTAIRMYERLRDEHNFTGGSSTVRQSVAKLKNKVPEVFIPLTAAPGEQVQVDFGHAQVVLAGHEQKVNIFCMRLKHSSVPFVVAFPTERLEAFLEGHVQGFAYFGGVPREGLYDNAKTQVVKILEGPYRQEHEDFSSLRSHYLFNSLFCRPRKGNEKGAVEGLVKQVRSQAMVPVPECENLEELNALLLNWCKKEKSRNQEKWLAEQAQLRPLPVEPYSAAKIVAAKVSSYSLVTIDRNRYSVPTEFVGENLFVKAYVNRIEVLHRNHVIATHDRCYGRNHTSLQLEHYLNALEKKPHAVTHATVVRQLPLPFQQVKENMEQAHGTGYKDFLRVLLLTHEYPLNEIGAAITDLGASRACEETLRHYLQSKLNPLEEQRDPQRQLLTNGIPLITIQDIQRYDLLLQGVRA